MLGNLSSRSRGFNSLTVKASQPAGSESCMWYSLSTGNSVPKPAVSNGAYCATRLA